MIKNKYQDFNEVMDDLGLFINDKTGGFYESNFDGKVVLNDKFVTEKFDMIYSDNLKISFFSGSIFLPFN